MTQEWITPCLFNFDKSQSCIFFFHHSCQCWGLCLISSCLDYFSSFWNGPLSSFSTSSAKQLPGLKSICIAPCLKSSAAQSSLAWGSLSIPGSLCSRCAQCLPVSTTTYSFLNALWSFLPWTQLIPSAQTSPLPQPLLYLASSLQSSRFPPSTSFTVKPSCSPTWLQLITFSHSISAYPDETPPRLVIFHPFACLLY